MRGYYTSGEGNMPLSINQKRDKEGRPITTLRTFTAPLEWVSLAEVEQNHTEPKECLFMTVLSYVEISRYPRDNTASFYHIMCAVDSLYPYSISGPISLPV